MRIIIFVVLCLGAIRAIATEPTIVPDIIFHVTANNFFVSGDGTWAATSGVFGPNIEEAPNLSAVNISELSCQRKERTCWEALSWVASNKLKGALIRYAVTSWTENEIKAESPLTCQTTELTFVVGSNEALKIIRNGGLMKSVECPADHRIANPIVMKLVSPKDSLLYYKK